MEITSNLSARAPHPDAGPDPLQVLDGLVSTLVSLESAIASLQGLREYTLGLASRVADVMSGARPPGFNTARWDSVELAQRAVAAEIGTATRANDRTIQRQMCQAVELLDRFPATFGALAQGRIGLAHARIIQDAGTPLDDPAALARYEAVVVPCAEREAPARVRRLAVREAEKAQPEPLATRHERAAGERRVRVTPLPDGMAELAAVLPAAVAYGIHDRLTQMARVHAELAEDSQTRATHRTGTAVLPRNTDQLRADLLADLLLRGAPTGHDTPDGLLAGITARVDVTVPVLTLIEREPSAVDDSTQAAEAQAIVREAASTQVPAELDGRHPIDPATARILAGQATGWNRVLTDPVTGAVLAVDRYRPGEDLKRLLTARDSRCRFPGCGIKARELDLDHTYDAALGGTTEAANLAGLCRRHHTLKHHSRWTTRQTGAGDLEWTSPTGRKHTDHPPIPPTSTAGAHSSRRARGDAGEPGHATDPPPF